MFDEPTSQTALFLHHEQLVAQMVNITNQISSREFACDKQNSLSKQNLQLNSGMKMMEGV